MWKQPTNKCDNEPVGVVIDATDSVVPSRADGSFEQHSLAWTRESTPCTSQSDEDEDKATVELAAILTATSTPVSPGPSSPPLEQTAKQPDIVPPTRPSSTPFPNAQQGQTDIQCLVCHDVCRDEDEHMSSNLPEDPQAAERAQSSLADLPAEIHECILDHLFGYRVSTTSPSSLSIPSVNARSWSTALRHSRRKELSNLALVTPLWRDLVQQRLYRHIKLKATIDSCNHVMHFFSNRPHLRQYVKHVEVWFPVFQPKLAIRGPLSSPHNLPTVSPEGITSATYALPTDNSALVEIFYLVGSTFPDARVMTLEGGERKKAPRVQYTLGPQAPALAAESFSNEFPVVPSIRTLVIKGQWNILRSAADWNVISSSIPNLEEWHGTYAKPKSKSYLSMAAILERLNPKISRLNLCLECDYRREMTCPPYYAKVCEQVHWCEKLAKASTNLEHLSYTGRVCHGFFETLARITDPRTTKLKTIDITVKNCCRPLGAQWNESGSGITDMHFINAFEALVLGGIRALDRLKAVELLRIRYVDLDSPVPPLNPYFVVRDGWCSGVWSDQIVAEINRVRPDIRFEELVESFGEVGYSKEGRLVISPDFPKSRVLSLKLSNYAMLAGGITIV